MSATALHDALLSSSARVGEYAGANTATDFGDARAEFAALRDDCGVYDLGWRAKIAATGKDRVRWLNGMVTNNIRDLEENNGVYAFLLNPQGRILGDLFAYNRGDSFLLDTDQSQAPKVLEGLGRYIIMDEVKLTNISDSLTAIGAAGPKARQVLAAAGFMVPELQSLQVSKVEWNGQNLDLVRTDNPALESYEIWLEPGRVNLVWDGLIKAGARAAGTTALELLRIASGRPRYGQDIRDRDLAQETGQERALNFSKGCYIGQEIVERIRSRGNVHRKFTGLVLESTSATPGARIESEDKEVGEITSVAEMPTSGGEKLLGLGYVRREAADKPLTANGARVTPADLPFKDVLS